VPAADLVLEVEPRVADQELVAATAAGAAYWEGLVRVRGTRGGRPVRGHGYVELTGYAGAPLRF
jgi:predicted secreted hydrolase